MDTSYLPTLVASSLAGSLARIPCHPIDTIKARLQVQAMTFNYSSIGGAFKDILRSEGVRGMYRGFGITFFGSAPAGCLYFMSYEMSKKELSSYVPIEAEFTSHFIAGIVAETIACLLYVPIDVLKERMQIQRHQVFSESHATGVYYKSSFDGGRQIIRTEGLSGFYKGYFATVLSFGPFTAFYFMFYEFLKAQASELTDSPDLPFQLVTLSSCVAGAAASFITNPLDLVKLRLQVQRGEQKSVTQYRHMFDGLNKLVREEGVSGMLKGVKARMLFHSLSTAVLMTLFEEFKKHTASLTLS